MGFLAEEHGHFGQCLGCFLFNRGVKGCAIGVFWGVAGGVCGVGVWWLDLVVWSRIWVVAGDDVV